jgi:hypothetical protein
MEVNPYESPRPGEKVEERVPNGATSVLQLLTEIRDGQRDMLELQRQALAAQQQWGKNFNRFRPLVFIPVLLIAFIPLLFRWFLFPMPPRPPTVAPVPARPANVPPFVPPAASLDQRAAR